MVGVARLTRGVVVDDDLKLLSAARVAEPAAEAGAVERPGQRDDLLGRLVLDLQGQRPHAAAEEPREAAGPLPGHVQNLVVLPVDVVLLLGLQGQSESKVAM